MAVPCFRRNLPMVVEETGDILSDLEGLMVFRIFP